ncbi:MAG: archaemetzincin family Zn-dependent metalloprotease [Candidatus Aenigmatarchaeota archaeon]
MLIKVIQLGKIPEKFVDILIEELNRELSHRFQKVGQMKFPERSYDKFKEQYKVELVMDELRDKGIVLGVTDEDIYANGLNYVYGQAEYRGPAIVSMARLKPEFYGNDTNFELLKSRLVKECIHELGHVFGLNHCDNPKCVMSYSNNIKPLDRKTKNFCDSCQVKISTEGIEL